MPTAIAAEERELPVSTLVDICVFGEKPGKRLAMALCDPDILLAYGQSRFSQLREEASREWLCALPGNKVGGSHKRLWTLDPPAARAAIREACAGRFPQALIAFLRESDQDALCSWPEERWHLVLEPRRAIVDPEWALPPVPLGYATPVALDLGGGIVELDFTDLARRDFASEAFPAKTLPRWPFKEGVSPHREDWERLGFLWLDFR